MEWRQQQGEKKQKQMPMFFFRLSYPYHLKQFR
jgi:hypothetical protein